MTATGTAQLSYQWYRTGAVISGPPPASASFAVGYYIYRGNLSGGTYTKLNSTPISLSTYTDSAVQPDIFPVDSNNVESAFSNELSATVPIP